MMSKRFSYDEVVKIFEENGCKLLSQEYTNSTTPLEYVCNCGNASYIRLSDFKKGKRCKECMKKKLSQERSHSYSSVKMYFEGNGCVLLSSEYKNNRTKMDYICECGTFAQITFYKFQSGQRCKKCKSNKIGMKLRGRTYEERRGENHPNWKSEKTDEEREQERKYPEYNEWRRSVFARDDYTCQCCGQVGYDLVSHHLDGYHWCKEKRVELSNGITLCVECHDKFHQKYGKHNNSEKQFHEFILENRSLTKVS
jgi:5-methylcytosine-specific restriction endonuclease McrA